MYSTPYGQSGTADIFFPLDISRSGRNVGYIRSAGYIQIRSGGNIGYIRSAVYLNPVDRIFPPDIPNAESLLLAIPLVVLPCPADIIYPPDIGLPARCFPPGYLPDHDCSPPDHFPPDPASFEEARA